MGNYRPNDGSANDIAAGGLASSPRSDGGDLLPMSSTARAGHGSFRTENALKPSMSASASFIRFATSSAGVALHLLFLSGSLIFFVMLWKSFAFASFASGGLYNHVPQRDQHTQAVPDVFKGTQDHLL